jgi:hypothetical protein
MEFKLGERVKVVQKGTVKVGGVTLTNNVLDGAIIRKRNEDGSYQVDLTILINAPGMEDVRIPAEWIQPSR